MRRGQKDSVTPVHLLWDPGMKLNLTKNDDQGHGYLKSQSPHSLLVRGYLSFSLMLYVV